MQTFVLSLYQKATPQINLRQPFPFTVFSAGAGFSGVGRCFSSFNFQICSSLYILVFCMSKSDSQSFIVCLLSLMMVIDLNSKSSIPFTGSTLAPPPIWITSHTHILWEVLDLGLLSVALVGFNRDGFVSQFRVDSMSNCYVLPSGRFISGVCQWNFRFVTGECPSTQRYGGFTLVFDPGIGRVTILLTGFGFLGDCIGNQGIDYGIDDFPTTLPVDYRQEAVKSLIFLVMMALIILKKSICAMNSPLPQSWAVGDDDDGLFVQSNTSHAGSLLLCQGIWCSSLMLLALLDFRISKIRVNEKAHDGVGSSWDRFEKRARSLFFRITLIRTNWYQTVDDSELSTKALGFVIRCAIWCFYNENIAMHNFRIRRLITEVENSGIKSPLASKALKKASSISLLNFYHLHYMAHIYAYIIICFCSFFNDFVNSR